MARTLSLPFSRANAMHASVSLPCTLAARLRAAAVARDASILRVLYDAVEARIAEVEAEPRVRSTKRATAYEAGSENVNFSLPVALHARCLAVARTTLNVDGEVTGSLSYVIRRCIGKHYPDAAPLSTQPKEPPMASVIMLLPLPPALHTWMRQQTTDMSKQIRGAIDVYLAAVSVNPKVNKTTSPYQGKGKMKPVPIRVPLAMHAGLKDAAAARGVTMSAIARICIALHVQQAVRGAGNGGSQGQAAVRSISTHKAASAQGVAA